MIRTPRALDLLSILLVIGAALALVLPSRERGVPAASVPVPTVGAHDATPVVAPFDSSYAGIVRGNLFSLSRRTPSSRFVAPPGTFAGDPAPAAPIAPFDGTLSESPASNDVASEANASGDDAVPRLYGIVTVDGRRSALLRLVRGRAPSLYGDGEGAGGYRVREVRVDRVLLQTPSGTRTMRLTTPAPASDSSTPVP